MQQDLWQDGYSVLRNTQTGEIGKTRLKRFLNWLDAMAMDWKEPDLEGYAEYLRDERELNEGTVYHTLSELRNHYIAVLSDPKNYEHVEPRERSRFVNRILEHLGYNSATINYHSITAETDFIGSENLNVVMPEGSTLVRDSILKNFVYWLDETGRHWSYPDLLYYKLVLQKDDRPSIDFVKNAINCIRKRYFELAEDKDALACLSAAERKAFKRDLRKRLAYLDEYPSKQFPTREMIENDPHNGVITDEQVQQLLLQPDTSTFTGVRDRAMIGLVLATGIQQADITKIHYDDIFQTYEGQPALYVHPSKTREERYIPYDDYLFVKQWIIEWLESSDITDGPVFRGTYGNRDVLRPNGIASETASDILSRYPIYINGFDMTLLFSDLRAVAGRRWYDNGIPLEEIERRLSLNYRRSLLKLIGLRLRPEFS